MRDHPYLSTAHVDALAAELHHGQTDKAGVPYINHPRTVSRIPSPFGATARQCGLLHDVVEDCNITTAELRARGVDPIVVRAVGRLTRDDSHTYHEGIALIANTGAHDTSEYVPHGIILDVFGHPLDREVTWDQLTKLADNLHNGHQGRLAALDDDVRRFQEKRYGRARKVLVEAVGGDVAGLLIGRAVAALGPSEY